MVVEGSGESGGTGGAASSGDVGTSGGGETSASGASAAPGAAGGETQAAGAGAAAAGTPGAEGVPNPFTPNFKYKVLKEEKELPEWARPFVTSADLEKQFKDTFERADGIEAVKQHRDSLVQENTAMREEWAPVVQNTRAAMEFARKGDLDSFFEIAGIPEVAVLKYALHRLQLRENPAALQQHEQQRQQQLENLRLQQELEQTSAGYQNLAVQTREIQLDTHLSRPENLSAVQAFDARVGKPGAFKAEVIRRGQAYAAQGFDAPVEQLTTEILNLIGWQGQNPPPVSGQNGLGATAPAAGTEPPPAATGKPPTLPHLRGRGTSPVKKAAKSTDELRELARQMRP